MKERLFLFGVLLVLLAGAAFVALQTQSEAPHPTVSKAAVELEFASLSRQNTNQCSGPGFLSSKTGSEYLQGSCCSPMDFHRYQEQLEGLKAYADFGEIPTNPYNVSVALAQKLLAYRDQIRLTPAQQAVYDEAVKTSSESGPCCCKCWRWYAFEGLAKHLIVEKGFDAKQVAQVWDLLDGCGGTGHAHGGPGPAV